MITVPMIVNGPAYQAGEAPIINPSQCRLVASEHPSATRKANMEIMMPVDWKVSHATCWPECLEVQYSESQPVSDQEQRMTVQVTLSQLPPANVKDGIVQIFANDGQNLMTAKVNFIWP